MAASKLEGYHFAQSEDGAFAVEVDEPCPGTVTITWKPKEYPGESATIEMPQALFLAVMESYIAEINAGKRSKSSPRTGE